MSGLDSRIQLNYRTIKNCAVPLGFNIIEYIAGLYQGELPESYRRFLKEHPVSGSFERRIGSSFRSDKGPEPFPIDLIYGYDPGGISDIRLVNTQAEDRPSTLLVIADDGFGDLVCLDLSGENSKPVIFWDHGLPLEKALFPVADSFDAFIEGLEVLEN